MVVVHVYVDHLVDDVDVIDVIIQVALLQRSIGRPISILIVTDILLILIEILDLLCQNVVDDSDTILNWTQIILQILIHLHVPIAGAWDEPVEKMVADIVADATRDTEKKNKQRNGIHFG